MVLLHSRVRDADSGTLLPCRIRVEDADGRYCPPEGHRTLPPVRAYNRDISYEPDVLDRGITHWAMCQSGEFTTHLKPRNHHRVTITHGYEYERGEFIVDLKGMRGVVEHTFELKRRINMRRRGWISTDTHIHNLNPLGALRQMKVEALDYANISFMGGEREYYHKGYLTGKPSELSDGDRIIYVVQELRDAQWGHLMPLNQKAAIQPVLHYTGFEHDRLPTRPNEPFNWEVVDAIRAQGGLVATAHFQHWPGHGTAVCAALDKLDAVEFGKPDMVMRGPWTHDEIKVPGFEDVTPGQMWYHMLNCGARLPLIGGTDKMSAWRLVGGACRTYARVKSWTHAGFIDAVRHGRTFVTNGPMLSLTVNGHGPGATLRTKGPRTVQVNVECSTQQPCSYLQVIHNGQVAHEFSINRADKHVSGQCELTVPDSGWLALRAGDTQTTDHVWEGGYVAAHTSPVYIMLNGESPADEYSARYLMARMDVALHWAQKQAVFTSETRRREACAAIRQARTFYQMALKRAKICR